MTTSHHTDILTTDTLSTHVRAARPVAPPPHRWPPAHGRRPPSLLQLTARAHCERVSVQNPLLRPGLLSSLSSHSLSIQSCVVKRVPHRFPNISAPPVRLSVSLRLRPATSFVVRVTRVWPVLATLRWKKISLCISSRSAIQYGLPRLGGPRIPPGREWKPRKRSASEGEGQPCNYTCNCNTL